MRYTDIMMRTLLSLSLLACSFLSGAAYAYDREYPTEERPHQCRDVSGQEKKACIREVKKAHAERYRSKRMERREMRENGMEQ